MAAILEPTGVADAHAFVATCAAGEFVVVAVVIAIVAAIADSAVAQSNGDTRQSASSALLLCHYCLSAGAVASVQQILFSLISGFCPSNALAVVASADRQQRLPDQTHCANDYFGVKAWTLGGVQLLLLLLLLQSCTCVADDSGHVQHCCAVPVPGMLLPAQRLLRMSVFGFLDFLDVFLFFPWMEVPS